MIFFCDPLIDRTVWKWSKSNLRAWHFPWSGPGFLQNLLSSFFFPRSSQEFKQGQKVQWYVWWRYDHGFCQNWPILQGSDHSGEALAKVQLFEQDQVVLYESCQVSWKKICRKFPAACFFQRYRQQKDVARIVREDQPALQGNRTGKRKRPPKKTLRASFFNVAMICPRPSRNQFKVFRKELTIPCHCFYRDPWHQVGCWTRF